MSSLDGKFLKLYFTWISPAPFCTILTQNIKWHKNFLFIEIFYSFEDPKLFRSHLVKSEKEWEKHQNWQSYARWYGLTVLWDTLYKCQRVQTHWGISYMDEYHYNSRNIAVYILIHTHYRDGILGPSKHTDTPTVCSKVYYANNKRKHQSSASLVLCEGNPSMDSLHKGPVLRNALSRHSVSWNNCWQEWLDPLPPHLHHCDEYTDITPAQRLRPLQGLCNILSNYLIA